MKKIYSALAAGTMLLTTTGCIEEINPASSTVTVDQVQQAPNTASKLVSGLTANMTGNFNMRGTSNTTPWDYGYTTFFLMRDLMGQDIASIDSGNNWYSTWAFCGTSLGPTYLYCQIPWSLYYQWIKNCNNVLAVTTDEPNEENKTFAGIAHTLRAMFYMDLARMYCPTTYGIDQEAPTVPIITQHTTPAEATNNPRATNKAIWEFILADLDRAETELAGYNPADNTIPTQSVVYGLKARAYLVMEDWANAEKYAQLAKANFTPMSNEEYTSRETGFNSPNGAWMFSTAFKSDDPCIILNDADSSWGSWMILEITSKSGCGYAANYGAPFFIDRHLYNTIPASDCRKDCFISFDVPEMEENEALAYVSEHYSDYPETIVNLNTDTYPFGCGGASVKFRAAGGDEGHNNQYVGFTVSVPLMRVEEMELIEAEAAGMQNEGRGIQLLTAFAQRRDPEYVYGMHNETYGSDYATAFQNEVWWQRRVEFWGEGLATFDIKRLNKGIIRSYEGTNHADNYQWNTTTPPQWMTLCIIGTEADYNKAIINNPTPLMPQGNSPKYNF